MCALAVVCIVL